MLSTACGEEADVVLLTGRIRPFERDRLVKKWKPFLKAASPNQPEKPIVLVSTQCIEVGADFSFDALVTEAASLDALRQRFGRLNRMGNSGSAPATILVRDQDAKQDRFDPIYGTAVADCWRLLNEKATGASEGKEDEGSIDFGIDALDSNLIDVDDLSPSLAPRPDAPVLLPGHLDLLSQTAPAPAVEPDIALFLHGKKRSPPEARVVWRSDLAADNSEIWMETVALCPPVSGEMLAVPLYRLRAWLANKEGGDEDASDVEGADGDDSSPATNGPIFERSRSFLIWRGRDRSELTNRPKLIMPNDVVVVPAEFGISGVGQSAPAQTLGKDGLDLWEASWVANGQPPALRLHRKVLEPWIDIPPLKGLIDLAKDPDRDNESLREAIDAVLEYERVGEDQPHRAPEWLLRVFEAVRNGRRIEDHPAGGVVLFAKTSVFDRNTEPDLFADDDDLASSWMPFGQSDSDDEVTLAGHSASVERAVEKIASRCLSDEFLEPLRLAAYWHDIGKLDERFQLVLRQGNEIAMGIGKPLAKSVFLPTSPARRAAIHLAANLPKGFRHEMLSFQLVQRYCGLPPGEEETHLILHLIASHHGHARPFAPLIPDPEPPAIFGHHDGMVITLDSADRRQLVEPHNLGSGISERFWRLTRRYGWWGLAYLEAVLRLGDWYGSEQTVEGPSRVLAGPRSSRERIAVSTAATEDDTLVLTGLDGGNPLGFLAALGTLLILRQGAYPQACLSWRRTITWQPVVTGIYPGDRKTLCDTIAAALRGQNVPDHADDNRAAAQKDFDAAKKALKNKQNEIKKRRLRGGERKAAIKAEEAPLEEEVNRKRIIWLEALKAAVPRPELALGKRIDCTDEEYRSSAANPLKTDGSPPETR
jgi:CRISPR-associated endonuclease/helicase Cas3